jgi:hypothetical protein
VESAVAGNSSKLPTALSPAGSSHLLAAPQPIPLPLKIDVGATARPMRSWPLTPVGGPAKNGPLLGYTLRVRQAFNPASARYSHISADNNPPIQARQQLTKTSDHPRPTPAAREAASFVVIDRRWSRSMRKRVCILISIGKQA